MWAWCIVRAVRNFISIPEVAKWRRDRSAYSPFCTISEMPPWVLIFLFSAYRAKWCSLLLFILGKISRGRRNSFGIFWRGQKYNLAFVWFKRGKFPFPNAGAGGSKLNVEAWLPGPEPAGGDAWQGRSNPESQWVVHVRTCMGDLGFLPKPPGIRTPVVIKNLSLSTLHV